MNRIDNLQTTSYQFKICVTLREYPQAIIYLEKVINFISEYSYEEIEILNRLSNELLSQRTKLLNAIDGNYSNSFNELKYHNRVVLDNYSKHVYNESIDLIKKLLDCLERIITQLIDIPSKALCSKIIGKIISFLSVYGYSKSSSNSIRNRNSNRINYLESALVHYKQALSLSLEYINAFDPLRFRIILSYCKFIAKYMKDYYRAMLFCMNIIKEIHTCLRDEDMECDKDIQLQLSKFKRFYEENTIEYNKTVAKYFP